MPSSIDYSRVNVLAVEAIKELSDKFDVLKRENEQLRQMITVGV